MLVWGLLTSSIMIIGRWLIGIDVLVYMIFQRWVTTSKCGTAQISIRITTLMYSTWLLLIVLLLLTAFIVYLSVFLPRTSIIILLSSTILLLLLEHAFVILNLSLDAGLHVIVFLSRSDATRCFSFSYEVVVFLWYRLFSWHFLLSCTSLPLSIDFLLVSISRWTIAQYNTSASTEPTTTLLCLIIRRSSAVLIHVRMQIPAFIPVYLCLRGRPHITHGYITRPWVGIPQWTVLWSVFVACICVWWRCILSVLLSDFILSIFLSILFIFLSILAFLLLSFLEFTLQSVLTRPYIRFLIILDIQVGFLAPPRRVDLRVQRAGTRGQQGLGVLLETAEALFTATVGLAATPGGGGLGCSF